MSESLKRIGENLSKSWKVERTHEPFYDGKKGVCNKSLTKYYSLYNDNLLILTWPSGEIIGRLFDDNDEYRINVSCFTVNPNDEVNVVIATETFLLQHYKFNDNYTTKELIRSIKGHNMPILCMAYDATGTLVATGCADRNVRVFDIEKGYCTHNYKEHNDIVRSVMFQTVSSSANQLTLFSCSDDNTVHIYDLNNTKNHVKSLREHMSLPTSIAISSDNVVMASVSRDKVINVYQVQSNYAHIKTIPVMDELETVVILHNEHVKKLLKAKTKVNNSNLYYLLVAGQQGIIRVYTIDIKTLQYELLSQVSISNSKITSARGDSGLLRAITNMYYNYNNKDDCTSDRVNELVVVTADHNFITYELNNLSKTSEIIAWESVRNIIGFNDDILDIAYVPVENDDEVGYEVDRTGSNSVIHTSENQEKKKTTKYLLALVTNSPQVKLIDEKYESIHLDGHTDIVLAVDVAPSGKHIVTSSKDHTIRLWDVATGDCIAVGEGHTDSVSAVSMYQLEATLLSKQHFVISGGADKILKKWSLNNTKLTATHSVRAHDKEITCVSVAPNDVILASGSQDKSIRLWKSADLTAVATLKGHKRSVWKVSFSPVDRCLVSCSGDRTVKLWSVADYSCIRTFEGHTASVLCVKFINKGTQLVSGSADGLVRLWTIQTGECEGTFDEHQDKIWSICVSSNNEKQFFSGGSDSKLLKWMDVTAEEEAKRLSDREQNLLLEQALHNDVRNKRYAKALHAAIELGHSHRILTTLTAILEEEGVDIPNDDPFDANAQVNARLNSYVALWSDNDIEKVVGYMKEWNTNARYSYVSQCFISSLFTVVKVEKLLKIRSVCEAVPALLSYTDRHYQRVDKLYQGSYLLEYMASMMSLLPSEAKNASISAITRVNQGPLPSENEPLVIFGNDTDHNEESSEEEVDNSVKEEKVTKKRVLKEKKPLKNVEKKRKK